MLTRRKGGDIFEGFISYISNLNKKYKLWVILLIIILPVGSITGYMVYTDNPGLVLEMVSGTEYITGEQGQLIIRLTDYDGNPISGADCTASILYPNKANFVLNQIMTESTQAGNYYYMFTPPSTTGIYEHTITCSFVRGGRVDTSTVSHSFHVSPALVEMIQQINATRVQLEQTKSELMSYITEINESLDESIENKTAERFNDFYDRMDSWGDSMSKIFSEPVE